MALDTSDSKLAEKLRREDPEQFQTLVRMHLSFVLDLTTDDKVETSGSSTSSVPATYCPSNILHALSSMWKDTCHGMQSFRGSHQQVHNQTFICYDCATQKYKLRQSKWPFSKKPKCLSKGVMEGAPLTQEGICQVYQLIEYLSKEQNISQEGIFRRSGKMTRQQELKSLLNQGVALNLDTSHFSVHDCASVLKNFLAELPEPLLTDAHYPAYCQIAELCGSISSTSDQPTSSSEIRLLRALQLLLLLLPIENRLLLHDVLNLLHVTASYESSNKMSADSLSTLFTPHLLCPRKLTPEAFHVNSQTMSGVVTFMIRHDRELFKIPPKLATDIQAYWIERERRKRTLQELNESMCDSTAANTVFSFVDRERTAQANNSNPTEAALAQLYAHIQSLPESSKKRKLIKQFNKENGQGTPLQHSRGHKQHLRSKSLGDSIKKHIFNKGLKRQKNNTGYFGALRSLSQEVLSSPRTPFSKMKLFQSSSEEEPGYPLLSDPIEDMPELKNSLCDSNSAVIRLRYSTKISKSTLPRRMVYSDGDTSWQEEESGSIRKTILDNLASQIAEKRKCVSNESSDPEYIPSFRKQSSVGSSSCECEDDGSPSPKSLCLVSEPNSLLLTHDESPFPTPSTPHRAVRGSRQQGTDTWPVSNPSAFLCDPPCFNGSVNSSPALPGFFSTPIPLGNANNIVTPRNVRSSCLVTSTPASQVIPRAPVGARCPTNSNRASMNHNNCLLTPIADENNSMSPITRSTQKMPKAMQETMMTPRSRKPVIVVSGSNLCHLANISAWRRTEMNQQDLTGVRDEAESLSSPIRSEQDMQENDKEAVDPNLCSASGDSLTSTFKSYLFSRSVLTASPVDLSFSSRTGDFDDSSCSESKILSNEALSESLLYCLDGNVPSTSREEDDCINCSSNECLLVKDDNIVTPLMQDTSARQVCGEPENIQPEGLSVTKANLNSRDSFMEKCISTSLSLNGKSFRKGVVHETSL